MYYNIKSIYHTLKSTRETNVWSGQPPPPPFQEKQLENHDGFVFSFQAVGGSPTLKNFFLQIYLDDKK